MKTMPKPSKRPDMPKPSKRPDMPIQIRKHIKTVADFYADKFDNNVNRLIDDGYKLIKRGVIIPNNNMEKTYFYAELEKIADD